MIIRNAKVVSTRGISQQDVLFNEQSGLVEGVQENIVKPGEKILDAEGLLLLPGAIDMHVHLRDPGATQKEDFFTGTKAALAGGVTTVVDMPNNLPTIDTFEALQEKLAIAAAKAACDYGAYFAANAKNGQEVLKAAQSGNIAGVKVFMGPTTGVAAAFPKQVFSQYGGLVAVHAEDAAGIAQNEEKFRKELGGKASCAEHNKIRPPEAAIKAVADAIAAIGEAGRGRLHVCHATTGGELAEILQAKSNGLKVTCEVTPHHLFLNEQDAAQMGNFLKVNPPLRAQHECEALWRGVADGAVDCIASDHAPHLLEEKERDYWNAPSGVPGVETMLPLMVDAAAKGKLSLPRVVQLLCANPAKLLGLQSKGAIERGKHADLVLFDLQKSLTVRNGALYTKCAWSPFEGRELQGTIEGVFLRGRLVFDGKRVLAGAGEGRLQKAG